MKRLAYRRIGKTYKLIHKDKLLGPYYINKYFITCHELIEETLMYKCEIFGNQPKSTRKSFIYLSSYYFGEEISPKESRENIQSNTQE